MMAITSASVAKDTSAPPYAFRDRDAPQARAREAVEFGRRQAPLAVAVGRVHRELLSENTSHLDGLDVGGDPVCMGMQIEGRRLAQFMAHDRLSRLVGCQMARRCAAGAESSCSSAATASAGSPRRVKSGSTCAPGHATGGRQNVGRRDREFMAFVAVMRRQIDADLPIQGAKLVRQGEDQPQTCGKLIAAIDRDGESQIVALCRLGCTPGAFGRDGDHRAARSLDPIRGKASA